MTLTLDEAIEHAQETSARLKYEGCIECAEQHEQLAAWLIDYKRLLECAPIAQMEKA